MSADRPQYGEYATPEEQRARAGLPPLDLDAVASANPPAGHPHPATTPGTQPTVPGWVGDASAASVRAPKTVTPAGRIVTFALLGFGLFHVLSSIPEFLNMATTLNQTMQLMGIDAEVTNFAAMRTGGIIAVALMAVGYALTAWLSIRRLRRHRSAWWIPLIGVVATMGLVSICMSVVMFSDPGLMQGMLTTPAG